MRIWDADRPLLEKSPKECPPSGKRTSLSDGRPKRTVALFHFDDLGVQNTGPNIAVRGSMPHPLRWFFPGLVYEITTRTTQGRFLLRPSAQSRARIHGVIGRALKLYDVQIHAFAVMSNHWQVLASARCGDQFAGFIGYVNSNIAREMGRLHQWSGPFWGRRARPIPCLDDDATIDRLRYCIAQGTKEGLVESPLLWPGASSTSALVENMTVSGQWVDRDRLRPALRAAARRQATVAEAQHTHDISFSLTPLPCWSHLDPATLRAKHQGLVAQIVRATKEARGSMPFLGVAAVLHTRPHDAPEQSASSPAPLCHATAESIRQRFRRAYAAFIDAYRFAARAVREIFKAGVQLGSEPAPAERCNARPNSRVDMPPGCYLSAICSIPQQASVLSSIVRFPDG
jgi:putative transposase